MLSILGPLSFAFLLFFILPFQHNKNAMKLSQFHVICYWNTFAYVIAARRRRAPHSHSYTEKVSIEWDKWTTNQLPDQTTKKSMEWAWAFSFSFRLTGKYIILILLYRWNSLANSMLASLFCSLCSFIRCIIHERNHWISFALIGSIKIIIYKWAWWRSLVVQSPTVRNKQTDDNINSAHGPNRRYHSHWKLCFKLNSLDLFKIANGWVERGWNAYRVLCYNGLD